MFFPAKKTDATRRRRRAARISLRGNFQPDPHNRLPARPSGFHSPAPARLPKGLQRGFVRGRFAGLTVARPRPNFTDFRYCADFCMLPGIFPIPQPPVNSYFCAARPGGAKKPPPEKSGGGAPCCGRRASALGFGPWLEECEYPRKNQVYADKHPDKPEAGGDIGKYQYAQYARRRRV